MTAVKSTTEFFYRVYTDFEFIIRCQNQCKGGCRDDRGDGFGHYMFHERWNGHLAYTQLLVAEDMLKDREWLYSDIVNDYVATHWRQLIVPHDDDVNAEPTDYESHEEIKGANKDAGKRIELTKMQMHELELGCIDPTSPPFAAYDPAKPLLVIFARPWIAVMPSVVAVVKEEETEPEKEEEPAATVVGKPKKRKIKEPRMV